jgi:hypothetical protein
MALLKWSQMENGTWNGKLGPYTLMTVALHKSDNAPDEWWVHPKVPGLKSCPARTDEEGKMIAQEQFARWLMEVV